MDTTFDCVVVEAGGSAGGYSSRCRPRCRSRTRAPASNIQRGYQSGSEPPSTAAIDETTGKVVGGSSTINAMIVNRGNPMDYEGWAGFALPDLSYAHVLPYFQKMGTWQEGADDWRGCDGPLKVSRCRAEHRLFDLFPHPAT